MMIMSERKRKNSEKKRMKEYKRNESNEDDARRK